MTEDSRHSELMWHSEYYAASHALATICVSVFILITDFGTAKDDVTKNFNPKIWQVRYSSSEKLKDGIVSPSNPRSKEELNPLSPSKLKSPNKSFAD